jgi:hypothetical protein
MCSSLILPLAAGCGADEGPGGDADPGATPTPSTSGTVGADPSDEPSAAPAGATALTTKGLSQGPPPSVDVLAAADPAEPTGSWSLVRPSGETTTLGVDRPFGFASTGNGLVVLEDGGGEGSLVSVIDGNGVVTSSEDALGYRLAVTPDGSAVAWLRSDRTTTVRGPDGTVLTLPAVPEAGEIGAVLGGGSCRDVDAGGRCTAYLNAEQAAEVYIASSDGTTAVMGEGLIRVSDVSPDDRLLGLVSVDDLGSCSAVVGDHPGRRWETCDHTLTSFSPDGSRVLGTDAYLDGFGQRSVAFLDGTEGTPLHEFTSKGKGPSVVQTVWEDEDHVLAVVYERGRWSVVRLGADGSAELALGPLVGSDLDRPFVLGER